MFQSKRKTPRKSDQSWNEFIDKHSEIAHWCRLLQECVLFFGTRMKKKDVFYTGINRPLLFNQFDPAFCCPLSTSTSYLIANRFGENESKGNDIVMNNKLCIFKTF